jgi:hypothetical protein
MLATRPCVIDLDYRALCSRRVHASLTWTGELYAHDASCVADLEYRALCSRRVHASVTWTGELYAHGASMRR